MNAGKMLSQTYEGLQGILDDYKELRADAIERMHDSFLEVVGKSEMPQITYYCPKCNRLPMYLFQKLGFALEEAHLLDQRALFRTLMGDSEIAERLSTSARRSRSLPSTFGTKPAGPEGEPPRERIPASETGTWEGDCTWGSSR